MGGVADKRVDHYRRYMHTTYGPTQRKVEKQVKQRVEKDRKDKLPVSQDVIRDHALQELRKATGSEEPLLGGKGKLRLRFGRKWARSFARRHHFLKRTFTNASAMPRAEEETRMRDWLRGLRGLIRGPGEVASPKWGIYPPSHRYNMDETSLPFKLAARATYTTPEERASGSIQKRCKNGGRFCTVVGCISAEQCKVPLFLIFKGMGDISFEFHAKLNYEAKVKRDMSFAFSKTALMNHNILKQWMQEVFIPHRLTHHPILAEPVLLLMDNCGETHQHAEVEELARANNIQIHFGPPNLTSKWQPCDAAMLQTFKSRALGRDGLAAWIRASKKNRKLYVSKRYTSQMKRVHCIEWSAKAWNALHGDEYRPLFKHAWEATGCRITADGSEDGLIKPQGCLGFAPPTP